MEKDKLRKWLIKVRNLKLSELTKNWHLLEIELLGEEIEE